MGVVGHPPRRGEVYLVDLNPSCGREIRKTRPCVVVSPDELNEHLKTLLVAPMTTGSYPYPFRTQCRFQKREGHIVLDQIRAVDASRLVEKLGSIAPRALSKALETLREMFAE